jgi:hypothetical protein
MKNSAMQGGIPFTFSSTNVRRMFRNSKKKESLAESMNPRPVIEIRMYARSEIK